MPIHRSRPKANFTAITNAVIRDSRLRGEERGLLLWLLSHAPHWKVIVSVVMKNMGWGRDKTYRILKRLMMLSYVERYQERDGRNGSFGEMVYVVRDQPLSDAPPPEAPLPEKRKAVKERKIDSEEPSPTPSFGPQHQSANRGTAVEFEQFWSAYKPDSYMPRHAAERTWKRMSDANRIHAINGLPVYLSDCKKAGRIRVSAVRYLKDRVWEGYHTSTKSNLAVVQPNSPQWLRWREYLIATGQPIAFMDDRARANKVVTVPSEWPPEPPTPTSFAKISTT